MIDKVAQVAPPAIPQIARQCLLFVFSPDLDVTALAQKSSNDIGLTTEILRVANSAALGSFRATKDTREAIGRIGVQGMRQILVEYAMKTSMQFEPSRFFNFKDFSRHSAYVGLLCFELAVRLCRPHSPTLQLAGLLHDVGLAIAAMVDRQHINALTRACVEKNMPFPNAEISLGLVPHREIGAQVLEQWQVPADVVRLVRLHDVGSIVLRKQLSDMEHRLVDILVLADSLSYVGAAGFKGYPFRFTEKERLLSRIGIDEAGLNDVQAKARTQLDAFFA